MKVKVRRLSYRIATKIKWILKKDFIEQKELARRLGKSEAEISKWLSGRHNFTIKSIEKIEIALKQTILYTQRP